MSTPLSLDDIFGGSGGLTREDQLDATAMRLLYVKEQIKALKEEQQALEDKVWTLTPDEAGEATVESKQFSFVVSRSELWKWNSPDLEVLAASNPFVGAVVKSKFSLPKNEYQPLMDKLPAPEAKKLQDTLTRTVGKPRIKIIKKA